MSAIILTKKGAEITHIDDARNNNFNANLKSGIVKGVLNEGRFYATGNVIALDTCELRIFGYRILLDETWSYTFANAPTTLKSYSLIAQIQVKDEQDVDFSLFIQDKNTALIQDNLYANINSTVTYQINIGNFDLDTTGNIINLQKIAETFTAGTRVIVGDKIVNELQFTSDPQSQIDEIKTLAYDFDAWLKEIYDGDGV